MDNKSSNITTATSLELLAPAKNVEYGIAAIDHGADAVYIGAEKFGARAAASNPVSDIAKLCQYAHVFGAKVYVTVNTIIYDNELADTERLIKKVHEAGADAILVQDMGILEMDLPPIPMHASTQTDNRTKEKVAWLAGLGFSRVVLARELSPVEISDIHKHVPNVELEAFVHGALCVSYSGLCYASQYCFGRSANRGECAQFCRLGFNLEDSNGHQIACNRHLLSLKDMCRINSIEEMAKAGVTSFKIEGRLKNLAYVKNVTAAYSMKLDDVIKRNPGKYRRASFGRCRYTFTPNVNKTFNRGYTEYFITIKPYEDITSFDTPKSKGEYVGKVKEIKGASFTVAGITKFANGDGLCFVNRKHKLEGFRVNRVEANKIYPYKMPQDLRHGDSLYRNSDHAFESLLSHKSAERKMRVSMSLTVTDNGFLLTAQSESGTVAHAAITADKQDATKPQQENIAKQLSKLGNTPFECGEIMLYPEKFNYFIPLSLIAEARRQVIDKLAAMQQAARTNKGIPPTPCTNKKRHVMSWQEKGDNLNISNKLARNFYDREGCTGEPAAFEIKPGHDTPIMQCRHCLRRALGHCTKIEEKQSGWKDPLYLRLQDGRKFRLQFDCNKCKMNIYAEN